MIAFLGWTSTAFSRCIFANCIRPDRRKHTPRPYLCKGSGNVGGTWKVHEERDMEQCGAKGRVRSMGGWREEGEVSIPLHPHSKSMMPTGHHRFGNSAQISVSLFESPSVRGWEMDGATTVQLSNCPSAQARKGLTTQPPVVPQMTSKGETCFKKTHKAVTPLGLIRILV